MPRIGFRHSPETRAKMKITRARQAPRIGFHHSEATREKMMVMDADQRAEALALYQQGLTGGKIAMRLGVGRDPIYDWLKRNKVEMRKGGFQKGVKVWNAGIKYDEVRKETLNLSGLDFGRGWNRGKHGIYSPEYIEKLRISHTGKLRELSSHWKGGISFTNQRKMDGPQYKAWRQSVYKRDGFQCQRCGAKSLSGNPVILEAHHIRSFAKYPEFRYDINNGITLCLECHCHEDKFRGRFVNMEACRV